MAKEKTLTVVATQKGHYGGVIRVPGTPSGTFTLTDPKHFSKRWMAKMGSEQAESFHADVQRRREIDHLTGERIASGGVHEALAIALEENEKLKREIAELKNGGPAKKASAPAKKASAPAKKASAPAKKEPEKVADDEPELPLDADDEPELPLDPGDDGPAAPTTRRRRRAS